MSRRSSRAAPVIPSLLESLNAELIVELRKLGVPEGSLVDVVGAVKAGRVIPFPRTWPELIPLWPNSPYSMTADKCEILYQAGEAPPKPFGPGGAPVLLKCRCPRGRPAREDVAPTEVEYLIEWRWPDGRKTDAEWYSAAAIREGKYLDRFGIPIAGRGEINLWAKIILAQRQAFAIEVEYPVRNSGFSGADEAPAYILHDGRALRPGGKIEAGTITGDPPLLQRKRRERWCERFEILPERPPPEESLDTAKDALLIFDRKGRALCAALLGIRALFYSLVSMDISVLLSGFRGTAKTSIAQIMHWGEGPCAAADEPDMSFRTTFLGSELTGDRAHDCAFLIDDGERVRAEPGAPLKPEVIKLISDWSRAAFDGAPARTRGNRHYTLAQQRQIQQLRVYSTETAIGLEESVLARNIWWSFETGEIELAPMLAADWQETPTWIICQETITAIAHALIRRVLDIWANRGRSAAVDFIREIDKEASAIAATIELGGKSEDRPRIQRGLAMIVAGGILCDAAVGADGLMRDLALHYGAQLARQQLERLASGSLATAGYDLEWFLPVYHRFVSSGDYLLLDAETGGFFESRDPRDAAEYQGIGYRWAGREVGFVSAARSPGGWRHRASGEDWIDPAKFLAECERRAKSLGSDFPFNRQTLAAHLLHRIGLTAKGNDGNLHKPYIPRSDLRHPDKGSQPRVFRIPHINVDGMAESAGRTGRPGEDTVNDCGNKINCLPALSENVSRLVESREIKPTEAGRKNNELEQIVDDMSPGLPVLPALNDVPIEFSGDVGEPIENIENSAETGNPVTAVHAELGIVATESGESRETVPLPGAEFLELGEGLGFPRLAGLGTGTWSVIPAGAAGWGEFIAGAPHKISIATERARRWLAGQEPSPAAPEPTTEAKADLPADDDGAGENRAPAGAAEALALTTEANKPGESSGGESYHAAHGKKPAGYTSENKKDRKEASGEKNCPATQGKRPGASVKRPPGILVLAAEATWLGTDDVAGIEALAPVQREKRRKRPTPIEAVLDRARELGAEQVVLERTWTAAAPLPQIFQRGDAASSYLPSGGIAHSWATPAADSPWTLTNPGRLLTSIWARHKGGGASIEILVPQYVKGPWADAPDAETLAHALAAYRNSTADNGRAGFGYRNSAGNTFIRMWRALTRDRGVADIATDLVPSAYPEPAHAVPEAVADLAYSRLPMGAEANASSCVVIDGSSQYLRVLDINCGAGSIEHLSGAAAGGESFKRPGWWRVRYRMPPGWPNTLPVPGWPLAPGEDGWLVSETLVFLAEIGAEIEIFEAYLWSRSTRALARLQHRLRDGRLYLIARSQDASLTPAERAGAGLALKAAKDTYKAGVGWFSRVSNRDKTELIDYHRPHWRHAIIARSTIAVLRDIFGAYQRTGLTPNAIAVDGLGYMTDLPAEQLAAHLGLPIGLGLGQYKHSHVVPGAAMLRALDAADGAALGLITGTKEAGDGADA